MSARNASFLMIIAAMMWGTNPALVQLADWHPLASAWLRGGFCGLVVIAYIAVSGRLSFSSFTLQFFCGLCLAINSSLFVAASTYTSPANAVVLMFIFPWITIALDYFTRGVVPLRGDILRLLLGLIGIAFIVSGGITSPNFLGDMFALCAGVAIALHITLSQKLSERHQGNRQILSAIALAWVMTFVGLSPIVLMSIGMHTEIAFPQDSQWLYLVAFGVLSALPWLLWGKAIAHISGHVIAALLGVEVFTAAVLGWLALDVIPVWSTWVGGVLVLFAAGFQIIAGSASETDNKAVEGN